MNLLNNFKSNKKNRTFKIYLNRHTSKPFVKDYRTSIILYCWGQLGYSMKLKIGFSVFALLLFNAVSHAQTLPCGGTDPDATCPIDTWVIVLMAAGSFFAVYTLLKRKKSISASTIR